MNTISEDGQPCVPWDDWEYVAWQYIQKLEQEVLYLREQREIEDRKSGGS